MSSLDNLYNFAKIEAQLNKPQTASMKIRLAEVIISYF